MLNGSPSNTLQWSRQPLVLYEQASIDGHSRLCADEQSARFAGAFSIRSILSHARPAQTNFGTVHQLKDPRFLSHVPPSCSYSSQPQLVCCDERSESPAVQLQPPPDMGRQSSMSSFQHCEGVGSCNLALDSAKVQGYLGGQVTTERPRQKKGNKRSRTIFAPFQLQRLEKAFERQQYVAGEERRLLANGLNLTETQVKVWFQNRRIRFRKQRLKTSAIL